MALVLTLLAGTIGVSAQTVASRTAEIHAHLQKAEAYLKAKDPNSAAKEFEAVLVLDPKNAEAYADLGVITFSQRDYQNAAQKFRKALAIDPSLTKTQALLGICERRLGDPSARALLEKVVSEAERQAAASAGRHGVSRPLRPAGRFRGHSFGDAIACGS